MEELTVTWSEVTFDGEVRDLIADGDRFVAVGHGSSVAAAWTSPDGTQWQEHEVPEQSLGAVNEELELFASMGPLVRLGDTLLSFGGMQFMDAVRGAGWRWADGAAWEVINSRSGFFAGRVEAVTASDQAIVAATVAFESLFGTHRVWRWAPAAGWAQTTLVPTETQDVAVESLAWSGGLFIAAGTTADAVDGSERWDWPRRPTIWTSTDGAAWTAVEGPPGTTRFCTVGAMPDGGFVVLGMTEDGPGAWATLDARSWEQGSVEIGPGAALEHGCQVAPVTGGFVAIATGGSSGWHLWTSRDGRAWVYQDALDISGARLAALRGRVLIAGAVGGTTDDSAARSVVLIGDLEP